MRSVRLNGGCKGVSRQGRENRENRENLFSELSRKNSSISLPVEADSANPCARFARFARPRVPRPLQLRIARTTMDQTQHKREVGRPFKKGIAANPKGRPRGIPDRRTKYRELIESRMPELIDKCVTLALRGDMQALRLCIERVLPLPKAGEDSIDLGTPLTGSPAEQGRLVLAAVSEGRIPPATAATLMNAIAAQARVVEIDELSKRIEALEGA